MPKADERLVFPLTAPSPTRTRQRPALDPRPGFALSGRIPVFISPLAPSPSKLQIMPRYYYKAVKLDGEEIEGEQDAVDEASLI